MDGAPAENIDYIQAIQVLRPLLIILMLCIYLGEDLGETTGWHPGQHWSWSRRPSTGCGPTYLASLVNGKIGLSLGGPMCVTFWELTVGRTANLKIPLGFEHLG